MSRVSRPKLAGLPDLLGIWAPVARPFGKSICSTHIKARCTRFEFLARISLKAHGTLDFIVSICDALTLTSRGPLPVYNNGEVCYEREVQLELVRHTNLDD